MLDRKAGKTEHFGFLLSAEIEAGVATTEQVLCKLADSLAWVEGIGEVDVECLGKIDVYEKEPDAITEQTNNPDVRENQFRQDCTAGTAR